MNLAQLLSRAGFCSRRGVNSLLAEKRVQVDGTIVFANQKLDPDAVVRVDGKEASIPNPRLWLYYKPRGELVTHTDPKGRPSCFEKIKEQYPKLPRLMSVGRLDYASEGLLILTNSPEVASVMEHPSSSVEREYHVRVRGTVRDEMLARLPEGYRIGHTRYRGMAVSRLTDNVAPSSSWPEFRRSPLAPAMSSSSSASSSSDETWDHSEFNESDRDGEEDAGDYDDRRKDVRLDTGGTNNWFKAVLATGQNREIRKTFDSLDLQISRLRRVRYGMFELGDLTYGGLQETRFKWDENGIPAPLSPEDETRRRAMERKKAVERRRAKAMARQDVTWTKPNRTS